MINNNFLKALLLFVFCLILWPLFDYLFCLITKTSFSFKIFNHVIEPFIFTITYTVIDMVTINKKSKKEE